MPTEIAPLLDTADEAGVGVNTAVMPDGLGVTETVEAALLPQSFVATTETIPAVLLFIARIDSVVLNPDQPLGKVHK